jgi:syntaxin 16
MATRNLTEKFNKIKNSKDNNNDEDYNDIENQLMKDKINSTKKEKKYKKEKEYYEEINDIDEILLNIDIMIKTKIEFQKKIICVNFSVNEEEIKLSINELKKNINKKFNECKNKLLKFKNYKCKNSTEKTFLNNLINSKLNRINKKIEEFKTNEKKYINILEKINKTIEDDNKKFEFMDDEINKNNKIKRDFNNDNNDNNDLSLIREMDNYEIVVDERNKEIINISENIQELSEMFKELSIIVIDQGTILDRIDANIESSVNLVKEGNVELHKAETHQKNSFSIKCIIILVIFITIMLIVLIIKSSLKK